MSKTQLCSSLVKSSRLCDFQKLVDMSVLAKAMTESKKMRIFKKRDDIDGQQMEALQNRVQAQGIRP